MWKVNIGDSNTLNPKHFMDCFDKGEVILGLNFKHHAMKTYGGGRGIAPSFLNLELDGHD
jgi:hypothetical protein